MMSSLIHLVGLRPRVYYTLTNFRGGGQGPLGPPSIRQWYCMNETTIRRWRTQDLHLQRHKSGRRYGGGHPLSYPIELEQDIVTWVLQRRDKKSSSFKELNPVVVCFCVPWLSLKGSVS